MPISSSAVNQYPALSSLSPTSFSALSAAAEAWLVRVLGRNLEPGQYTENFMGFNQPLIFLANTPVVSVDQVTIKADNYVQTYTPASNYYTFTPDGKLSIGPQSFWNQLPGWRPGVSNVAVTYTSSGLDQPIQDMLIGSVMNWWQDQANRSGLAQMEVIGSYTYQMRTDIKGIPPAVQAVLYPYRNIMAV